MPSQHAPTHEKHVSATPPDSAAMLKVISHPIRMRILGTLRVDGPQNVGSISQHIHEAPGVTSYHLSLLEKNQLAHKVPSPDGDSRSSWWEASQTHTTVHTSDASDESLDLFRRSAALNHHMAYERYLDHMDEIEPEWKEVLTSDDHVLTLSPEQTRGLIQELTEVIRKWENVETPTTSPDASSDTSSPAREKQKKVSLILDVFRWIP
ncbi:winged helix-turn-helix domain-containing protein [Alloscardovia macacae]|uniref:ArsR family transcriptional regulator n=1 Tax=Alloscardovia macacae TaxID=1160091 RepID=A0A261F6J5_9BIFI|nr:helix-turn-helix domain-containing protein [Alloscardovia macacae]OZG54704.1 ArsR family transcriptional regulator [Alloscardovia macacae]